MLVGTVVAWEPLSVSVSILATGQCVCLCRATRPYGEPANAGRMGMVLAAEASAGTAHHHKNAGLPAGAARLRACSSARNHALSRSTAVHGCRSTTPLRHNARDERSAPPRRRDDVLESDRRRRPPLPADQARLAGGASRAGATRSRCRASPARRRPRARCRPGPAGQRRLSPAAAPRRDRARPRRPRARPDRSRRSVPRRLGRARRRALLGIPAVAYCHSNIVAMARLAAGAPPRRARGTARPSAMRATSTRGFDLVLAPSRSMARPPRRLGRRACRLPAARRRHRGVPARRARDRLARAPRLARATPACSSTPAVSRPKSTSTSSPMRSTASARRTCCSPSAPARRRRRQASASSCSPFVASTRELATVLASADAFVHAGDQETFGLSVLEAMACGTPAVVRDAEGLGELADGAGARRGARRGRRRFAAAIAFALRRRPRRSDRAPRAARRRQATGASSCPACSATTCACSTTRAP